MDLPPISPTECKTDSSTDHLLTEEEKEEEDNSVQWGIKYGKALPRGVQNPVNRYLLQNHKKRMMHRKGDLLDRRDWALGSHRDVMAFAEPPEGVKVRSIAENMILAPSMVKEEAVKETVEGLSPKEQKKYCLLTGHQFVPLPMVEEKTHDGRTLNKIAGKKYQCEKCWQGTEECKAWNCAVEQCGIVVCGRCKQAWESKGKGVEMGG